MCQVAATAFLELRNYHQHIRQEALVLLLHLQGTFPFCLSSGGFSRETGWRYVRLSTYSASNLLSVRRASPLRAN